MDLWNTLNSNTVQSIKKQDVSFKKMSRILSEIEYLNIIYNKLDNDINSCPVTCFHLKTGLCILIDDIVSYGECKIDGHNQIHEDILRAFKTAENELELEQKQCQKFSTKVRNLERELKQLQSFIETEKYNPNGLYSKYLKMFEKELKKLGAKKKRRADFSGSIIKQMRELKELRTSYDEIKEYSESKDFLLLKTLYNLWQEKNGKSNLKKQNTKQKLKKMYKLYHQYRNRWESKDFIFLKENLYNIAKLEEKNQKMSKDLEKINKHIKREDKRHQLLSEKPQKNWTPKKWNVLHNVIKKEIANLQKILKTENLDRTNRLCYLHKLHKLRKFREQKGKILCRF